MAVRFNTGIPCSGDAYPEAPRATTQATLDGRHDAVNPMKPGDADETVICLRIPEARRWAALHGDDAAAGLVGSAAELTRQALTRRGVAHRAIALADDVLIAVKADRDADGLCGDLAAELVRHEASHDALAARFTPSLGWSLVGDSISAGIGRASEAAAAAARRRDLQPVAPGAEVGPLRLSTDRRVHPLLAPVRAAVRRSLAWALAATALLGIAVPFVAYSGIWLLTGWDPGPVVYFTMLGALLVTATTVYIEALRAIAPRRLPPVPEGPPPPASAIVAAYLPNEVGTIEATLRALLQQDYRGPLQVILAYNTPEPLALERDLEAWAHAEPRLTVMRVPGSTSKAANINAALEFVDGSFVAIFDADHLPRPDVFSQAWRWISDGADIVQGRCAVRNGDASWVSRMVAVEFEQMYGLSHPGRARVHGFGIFGGSNGFWRTDLLHRTRMQCIPLTEDIDATIRALLADNARIISDPTMVSWELAPTTMDALASQRMRWSQGWSEVSARHLRAALRSPTMDLRQRLGSAFLLGWREAVPWVGLQIVPLVAYEAVWRPDRHGLRWALPIFMVLSMYTVGVNVVQSMLGWRLAVPELRARRSWFVRYLLTGVWYAEWKACLARVCHLRHITGVAEWKVTPRTAPSLGPASIDQPIEPPSQLIPRTADVGTAPE